MINQWSQFSLRFLFVVAIVVAAYASGKATMARRVQISELDAARARERATSFETRLRSARIQLAAVQLAAVQSRSRPSDWLSNAGVAVNNRWIVNSMALNVDQHATHLDSLGIKLIGLANDGKSFHIFSDFSTGLTIASCDKVPTDFFTIEADDQDHLLLMHSDAPVPMSGIARLLPLKLADEMARAEAAFTAVMGLSLSDLEKTWFRFDKLPKRPTPNLRAHVTGHRLGHSTGRASSYPYRLPPAGSRPKTSMRRTSFSFRAEVLGE